MPASRDTRVLVSPLHAPSVDGLDAGRKQARRRAARRRQKTAVTRFVLFTAAAAAIGGAGYYGWQFYGEEQRNNSEQQTPTKQLSAEEVIDKLGTEGPWNGPGNPTFGVGEEP